MTGVLMLLTREPIRRPWKLPLRTRQWLLPIVRSLRLAIVEHSAIYHHGYTAVRDMTCPTSRNDQSGPSHLLERDAFVPPTYATSESSCTDSFCSPAVEFIRQPLWILAQVSKKLGIAMVRRIAANIAKLPEPAR
jgi:hypothetical protein